MRTAAQSAQIHSQAHDDERRRVDRSGRGAKWAHSSLRANNTRRAAAAPLCSFAKNTAPTSRLAHSITLSQPKNRQNRSFLYP